MPEDTEELTPQEQLALMLIKLNGANRAHVRDIIAEAEDEYVLGTIDPESDSILAGIDITLREKDRTIRAGIRTTPRLFDLSTVEALLTQTITSIRKEVERELGPISDENEIVIANHVFENLYSSIQYDEETGQLTVDPNQELSVTTINPVLNIANKMLNLKSKELIIDPTAPLLEHKLTPIIQRGVIDGNLDPSLAGVIIGATKMPESEIVTVEGEDFQGVLQDWEQASMQYMVDNPGELINTMNRMVDQVEKDYESFLLGRDTKGDISTYLGDQAESDSFDYFGIAPVDTGIPRVDFEEFVRNDGEFDKVVTGWIEDSGGFKKPGDAIDPRTGQKFLSHEQGAVRVANESVISNARQLMGMYIDGQGNISAEANDAAALSGVSVDDWIVGEIYKGVRSSFVPDQEGMTTYWGDINDQSEVNRQYAYSKNPSSIKKDLEAQLMANKDYWVNGKPVTAGDVDESVWAQWSNTFANNSLDAAMANIVPNLDSGVELKQFGDVFGSESNRKAAVMQMAINQGVIGEDTSAEFIDHFTRNILPRMSQKAGFSNATNMGELQSAVSGYIDELPAYDRYESDFRRQFMSSSARAPQIPKTFSFEGKTYDLPGFTVGAPKKLEFEFDPAFITDEVLKMAEDRPEFARFISSEMKKPGFMQQWQEASKPTFDAEAFESQRGTIAQKAAARLAISTGEAEEAQRVFAEEIAGDLDPTRAAPKAKALAAAEEKRNQDQFFAGAGFQRQAKFQAMTPGQTTEEFFAGQLPGFEQRYKDSAYFKQEESRLKQEAEQQAAREDRERRTRTERSQRERRALLRSGTGQGRGLSVFTRRQ